MRVYHVLLAILVVTAGCDPSGSTSGSAGTDSAEKDTATTSGLQTVTGPGFTLRGPSDWTVLPGTVQNVALSSPLDLKNPTPMVVVTVMLQPVRPGSSVENSAAGVLQVDRMGDPQAKESQITIDGRAATRIVTVTANTPNRYTTLKCVCPTTKGLFVFNAASDEAQINARMEALEAMILSIKFTE